MTANRWWVRLGALWLARIDGVSGQLRLAMLAVTGASTASLTLQSFGYGYLAAPFIGLSAIAGLAFAYYYSEGGVWNQMARDRADMSSNYATPQQRIGTEMEARAIIAALQAEALTDDQREALQAELDQVWEDRRDGIEIKH